MSTFKGSVKHQYSFTINPSETSPADFKRLGMIQVDNYVHDMSEYLTDPTPPKQLSWIATERTATRAGKYYDIDQADQWETFIEIIKTLGPTHFVNLTLKMEDPSLIRKARENLEAQDQSVRTFKKKKIDNSGSQTRDQFVLPGPGSPNERSELINMIIQYHKKGDNSICYQPGHSSNYFRVTSEKARVWADIMVGPLSRYPVYKF